MAGPEEEPQQPGVFDKCNKTRRRVPEPCTDKRLADPRELTFAEITSLRALLGTIGSQTTHIHGDHWEFYDANLFTRIKGNWDIHVEGNVILNVDQNRTTVIGQNDTETIIGDRRFTVIGTQTGLNVGAVTETYLGERTHVHQAAEANQQLIDYEYRVVKLEGFVVHVETTALMLNITGAHADFYGERFAAGIWLQDFYVGAIDVGAIKADVEGLKTRVKAVEGDIKGVQAQLGAAKPSLFAVTLKALIWGINQIF